MFLENCFSSIHATRHPGSLDGSVSLMGPTERRPASAEQPGDTDKTIRLCPFSDDPIVIPSIGMNAHCQNPASHLLVRRNGRNVAFHLLQ